MKLPETGDQIIEWNGVNLCNRSNDEVQQILLSQFSDDEVEIVYLQQDKFHQAYAGGLNAELYNDRNSMNLNSNNSSQQQRLAENQFTTTMRDQQADNNNLYSPQLIERDQYDKFAELNKTGGLINQSAGDEYIASGISGRLALSPSRAGRYLSEVISGPKGSIRRKISLSSLSHMWSK